MGIPRCRCTDSHDLPVSTLESNHPITFTFQFSEFVHQFEAQDITIRGTGNNFTMVDSDAFTIEVTPSAEGVITVSVANDAAGNLPVGDIATVTYDGTAPTVVITPDNQLTYVATKVFTFEFSEEVFDYTADDATVTNGTKGNFTAVDGDTYTLEVNAIADGNVILNALADGAMDAAGNGNQIGSAPITYNGTAPAMKMSAIPPLLPTILPSQLR
ncbi:Hypothetical protein PBC10988_39060 [Planctomycetales bacterium 10988]|nr:Hypothetical protein PBC10988_39060 [Planctomycetales bacterium 10988]